MQSRSMSELNMIELLSSLKRQRGLVAGSGVAFAFIALLLVVFRSNDYTAQALMAVETSAQIGLSKTEPAAQMTLPPMEAVMLGQIKLLQSRDIARAVADDLQLDKTKGFGKNAAEIIHRQIEIKPAGRSLMIDVQYRHPDAAMAEKIVNRYVELFQEEQLKRKMNAARRESVWLNQQLKNTKQDIEVSQQQLKDFKEKTALLAGSSIQLSEKKVTYLNRELMAAQVAQAGIDAQQEITNASEILSSPLMDLLKRDEAMLSAQLAQMVSKYGPNHPKILGVNAKLTELNSRKKAEMKRLTAKLGQDAITSAGKIKQLETRLNDVEKDRQDKHAVLMKLQELEIVLQANRDLHAFFLNRLAENRIQKNSPLADTRIVALSQGAIAQTGQNPLLVISFAGFVGVLFGLLVVLLMEHIQGLVRLPEQLNQLTGLPLLGEVPVPQSTVLLKEDLEQPFSELNDALRHLSQRLAAQISPDKKIMAITHCLNQQQDAMILYHVAQLLAMTGLRVLLIDGHLRQPKWGSDKSRNSLAEILLGKADETNCFIQDTIPGLTLLTGSPSAASDILALSEHHLRNALTRLQSDADMILIDLPESYYPETTIFAKTADHSVLLVPLHQVPISLALKTIEDMKTYLNNILGYVIVEEVVS